MTEVIAPPADKPVTNTRSGLIGYRSSIAAVICRIDSASPQPRRVSSGSNQLKHRLGLLARRCSGKSTAKPKRSARSDQPEQRS